MGKYTSDAKELLHLVGGRENIAAVSHCITRMRFVLNDPKKADIQKIEAMKIVKGSFTQAGQFQVIIGNTVSDFYNDFIAVAGIEGVSKDAVKSAGRSLYLCTGSRAHRQSHRPVPGNGYRNPNGTGSLPDRPDTLPRYTPGGTPARPAPRPYFSHPCRPWRRHSRPCICSGRTGWFSRSFTAPSFVCPPGCCERPESRNRDPRSPDPTGYLRPLPDSRDRYTLCPHPPYGSGSPSD